MTEAGQRYMQLITERFQAYHEAKPPESAILDGLWNFIKLVWRSEKALRNKLRVIEAEMAKLEPELSREDLEAAQAKLKRMLETP